MREKGWEERGPKAPSKNSDFGTPMILVLFSDLPNLSDAPLLRAMGFLVSQHVQLGAIPPPPFLSVSPLESMRSGGAIPPPQKGYLSDTCAIPYEKGKKGAIPPSAILSRKGVARYGGVSRTGPLRFATLKVNTLADTLSNHEYQLTLKDSLCKSANTKGEVDLFGIG